MRQLFLVVFILFFSCESEKKIKKAIKKEKKLPEISSEQIKIDGKIKKNDTFAEIMRGHLAYENIIKLFRASKKTNFPLTRIRQGHNYRIVYKDSSFYKFEYEIDSKGFYQIVADSLNFKSEIVLYEFDRDTMYAEGIITDNLYQTMYENNYPTLLAFELANVFAWDIDFAHEIRKNAKFQVYYENLIRNGKYIGVGRILSTKFENAGKSYSAFLYKFPDMEKYEYFDFKKENLKKAFLKAPVEYSRISGFFGNRFHPIQKRFKAHNGIDYVAKKSTPVMAVADGKIVKKGYSKYNGNFLEVKFNGGFSAFYLHLNGFKRGLKRGSAVKQGETIAYIGKTGLATGYHLCFQFRKHRKPFDFQKIKNPGLKKLPKEYYSDFESKMRLFEF